MNVGLLYAPVSIYQMTRGALVLFVGVLSVIFLRRRLWLYQLSSVLLPTYSALSSDLFAFRALLSYRVFMLVLQMDIPCYGNGRCFPRRS